MFFIELQDPVGWKGVLEAIWPSPPLKADLIRAMSFQTVSLMTEISEPAWVPDPLLQ